VVQAKGAFDQTIQGLYNAARYGLRIEVRVVLHKQTIPGLLDLMDYIYRNLPFVDHVALMGLENTGFAIANAEELWIDPLDYQFELASAVDLLVSTKINVSVYNLYQSSH
jgi:MoaA/NifB/PqqE/SkfB family radical SAM enzyme